MNEDLVVRYLSCNGSPSPRITEMVWDGDDLDCMQWKEETFNDMVEIGKFTMAQKINQKYCKPEEEAKLPPEYVEYSSIFEKEASECFPERRHWDHTIELHDDFVPKKGQIYLLPPKQQSSLDEWTKEQLQKGYIRMSKSPQATPFFFVEKKDAKALQPCQDYWYINEFTKPNAYPLPLISDLMIKLKGSKYFTKLDLRWGYNNVRIKEGDEWKAAFITNRGLFKPTVMFFGLQNSPATFQAMMDDYFQEYIDEGWIVIYMDDILIHAQNKEDLQEKTRKVLAKLKEHDLFLKLEKCKFAQEEVEFLGMIVTKDTIMMDPLKLAGIRD